MGVFAQYEDRNYPHRFIGTIEVSKIAGGTPSNPNVAEGYLRTKLADKDDLIRQAVAEMMAERGVDAEEATRLVHESTNVNGFRRDEQGLYIPGNNLKACLKEGACVAANAGKISAKGWGDPDNANYKKGLKAWFPEHVFVVEDRLYLGVTEPAGIAQSFVHTQHGSSIKYEEYVEQARIDFTVETDHDFKEEQWAAIWLTAQRQGLGASRSQGFGTFEIVRWEKAAAAELVAA